MIIDKFILKMSRKAKILQFWFQKADLTSMPGQNLIKKWFKGGPELDQLIKDQFLPDIQQAEKGAYENWKTDKEGYLAFIILTDQFTRSCFKATAKTRVMDKLALKTTYELLSKPQIYKLYYPMQKHFALMPLMHSELIEDQKEFKNRWQSVIEECKKDQLAYLNFSFGVAKFGHEHLIISEKFGRFPHYNASLNRQSTPDEQQWLKNFKGFG